MITLVCFSAQKLLCVRYHAPKYDMKFNKPQLCESLFTARADLIFSLSYAHPLRAAGFCCKGRLIVCDEVKVHNSRWLLSKVANRKPTMECTPCQRVRKKYVGIFGFASTKYLNEDSQTLGNKKPSLHRKATELQAPSS